MGDKISLRALFATMAIAAVVFVIIRMAIVSGGSNLSAALAVCVAMVVVTFMLFAIAFVAMLPLGIIAEMSRESIQKGASPFATDRLPDQQVPVDDSANAK
jgi:hypothetical protein